MSDHITAMERDRRIEALAAERVLGWKRDHIGYIRDHTEQIRPWDGHPWAPLTSISDAFALLEAHPEWPLDICRQVDGAHFVQVWMRLAPNGRHTDKSLPRAITYAALRAVGAGPELDALLALEVSDAE